MASTACKVIISLGVLLVIARPGQSQLPCTHPLRLSAPELFRHCTTQSCTYSDYSDYQPVPNSVQTVSTSQCSSGKTYQEKRTRTSSSSSCTDLAQTRRVCLPDQEDQLILALGLGGSNKNLNPVNNKATVITIRPSTNVGTIPIKTGGWSGGWSKQSISSFRIALPIRPSPPPPKCPQNNNVGQICSHLTGKRSALFEEFSPAEPIQKREVEADNLLSETETLVPFEWNEHGPRLRRHVQQCSSNEVQHVLFVLDSSGSIGSSYFQRMKDALGKLVPLFCKQVKFAMVTFSRNINLEFCFNCFENTYQGREKAQQAISNTKYHNSMTYTGAATKCICDELLSSSCGISSSPSCLDVVYITDGKSNDPRHRVCEEVECLHRHSGINTYAIGIRNFNQAELDCISHSSNILSAFRYNSFEDFEASIGKIIKRLASSIRSGNNYSCLQRDRNINPVNAVPYSGH